MSSPSFLLPIVLSSVAKIESRVSESDWSYGYLCWLWKVSLLTVHYSINSADHCYNFNCLHLYNCRSCIQWILLAGCYLQQSHIGDYKIDSFVEHWKQEANDRTQTGAITEWGEAKGYDVELLLKRGFHQLLNISAKYCFKFLMSWQFWWRSVCGHVNQSYQSLECMPIYVLLY